MAKEESRGKPNNGPATKETPSTSSGGVQADSAIWQDERFQHLTTDPRFRSLSKTQRKVKIDKRFQGMFTDEKFHVKYTVDKYGRKVNKTNAEDLRKFYEMESSDSEGEENAEKEQRKEEQAISREAEDASEPKPEEREQPDSADEEVPKTVKERLLDPEIDYARGEGRLLTDSSSEEESSDDEERDPELLIDHVWGELDVEAETTSESTKRLALCNMDWDRIRAVDLMILFSSFLPPGGSVLSIKIYPSEFGKERMAEEDMYGPQELMKAEKKQNLGRDANASGTDSDEELVQEQDSDAEQGDDYHMEKLRQYQLKRLRYYYAVIECDNVATADKLYQECDGNEYESSATRLDLRFIPDDTSFEDDTPTDVCNELPDRSSYKPRLFTTTALQQAKVDLTWDETAVERRELGDKLSGGKLDEVTDRDLRTIVAYSSEDDSDEDGSDADDAIVKDIADPIIELKFSKKIQRPKVDIIAKYKALLNEINENEEKEKKKNKYEMEFTWDVAEKKPEKDDKDVDVSVNAVAEKPKPQMTPIEKVLQKRNEKNKKRKDERKKKKLQAKGIDPDDIDSDDDSDTVPDGVDLNDPYFAEEFAGGDFGETKSKKKQQDKKQKKSRHDSPNEEEERQAKELQLLLSDDDLEEQGKQHFSLEKIQKAEEETKSKRKRRKQLKKSKTAVAAQRKEVEDNFQLNIADDRFKAIYASHHFNIDPTDAHYKKTKGMEQIIHEKLKRRHGNGTEGAATVAQQKDNDEEEAAAKRPKQQLEDTLLVDSLKRKIQLQQQK